MTKHRSNYPSVIKWREQAEAARVWANEYKMQRGCARCGYKEHPAALEFHHIDPKTKLFAIASGLGRGRKNLLAEMEKCEVLCANCHRVHTDTIREAARQAGRKSDESQQRFDFELRRIDPCRI